MVREDFEHVLGGSDVPELHVDGAVAIGGDDLEDHGIVITIIGSKEAVVAKLLPGDAVGEAQTTVFHLGVENGVVVIALGFVGAYAVDVAIIEPIQRGVFEEPGLDGLNGYSGGGGNR